MFFMCPIAVGFFGSSWHLRIFHVSHCCRFFWVKLASMYFSCVPLLSAFCSHVDVYVLFICSIAVVFFAVVLTSACFSCVPLLSVFLGQVGIYVFFMCPIAVGFFGSSWHLRIFHVSHCCRVFWVKLASMYFSCVPLLSAFFSHVDVYVLFICSIAVGFFGSSWRLCIFHVSHCCRLFAVMLTLMYCSYVPLLHGFLRSY